MRDPLVTRAKRVAILQDLATAIVKKQRISATMRDALLQTITAERAEIHCVNRRRIADECVQPAMLCPPLSLWPLKAEKKR